jgi:hypothetical protein
VHTKTNRCVALRYANLVDQNLCRALRICASLRIQMPFGMQLDMTQLAPFVALTAAAVGWIMLAFEKKANAELRRKLRRVETATVHATASK